MSSAAVVRLQVESALCRKIPSALTPATKMIRPVVATGIPALDQMLAGGLPVGAMTEVVGPECSGRTTLGLSFLAGITRAAGVGAWIDVSDALDPESAAAAGVDLSRLLWVRCGVSTANPPASCESSFTLPEKYLVPSPAKKGLHGGGFGAHPRNEVKGLSTAVSGFLRPGTTAAAAIAPRCAEPQRKAKEEREIFAPSRSPQPIAATGPVIAAKPWSRLEQALRVTDLLLQAGGFGAIVLDMGGIAPEHALRVPLATWFRYRAAAERSQTSIVLLTQHACAKSSAELVLRMQPGNPIGEETTVLAGIEHRVEILRERFAPAPAHVVPLRKPPQRERNAGWQSRATWAGRR